MNLYHPICLILRWALPHGPLLFLRIILTISHLRWAGFRMTIWPQCRTQSGRCSLWPGSRRHKSVGDSTGQG